MIHKHAFLMLAVAALTAAGGALAQDAPERAEIVNDEGGPVLITGSFSYSDPFFTEGVSEPLILLEDQGGFVTRNEGFLMPPESQVLGQLTSDFFTSPVSYSLSLPQVPQGTLHDVDNDGETDQGVQVFAVAYWSNNFGDPYLEQRDLYGGGWSGAYVTTLVGTVGTQEAEYKGGSVIVYAADDEQGFPSGFGEDQLLFTEDDPIVLLPQGYTVVNMDSEPFTFDRSREIDLTLNEGEGVAPEDFSGQSYTEAFDSLIDLLAREYPFTEQKDMDWEALAAEFGPRIAEAEANGDVDAYALAMRDFSWRIPDGHVSFSIASTSVLDEAFQEAVSGGLGMAIGDVDDGGVQVYFLTPGGPAETAGIAIGAQIEAINGTPIDAFVSSITPFSAPFSTPWSERLQQLRYATRFPLGTSVEVTYTNPGGESETATLETSDERDSFSISSFSRGVTGTELPVEFRVLDSGYGYVKVYSQLDDLRLTVQLWERMIQTFNSNGIPGLIIDLRQNGGGDSFVAAQMAGYLFDDSSDGRILDYNESYDKEQGEFVRAEDFPTRMYVPPAEQRYSGTVVVLVSPACFSACEFFSDFLSLDDRSTLVGMYPTGGGGGGVSYVFMPDSSFYYGPFARSIYPDGGVVIEGVGVAPDVVVPSTLENLVLNASGGDAVLDAAIAYLDSTVFGISSAEPTVSDGGSIAPGDSVEGTIAMGERVRYTLTAEADATLDISLGDAEGALDTYLRVYDADGALIAESDDIELGVQINSLVEGLEVAAGDSIIIEAGTYGDGSEGDYTLSVAAAK